MNYAGNLNVTEGAAMLAGRPDAVLIDVRTMAEWNWVGVPDVPGARFVEWVTWPGGHPNPAFVAEASKDLDTTQPLLMLCRSGARSAAAAQAAAEAAQAAAERAERMFQQSMQK